MPLPYETLALAIRRGQVAPCYLLAGPDGLQQREVIAALAAPVSDIGIRRLDGAACTPGDVAGILRTPSFVAGRLVIVDEPPWILPGRASAAEAGDAERPADAPAERPPASEPRAGRGKGKTAVEDPLLRYLDAPAPGAVLVLRTAGEPDRRRRLTKRVLERGVLVETVAPRDNRPWLRDRCEHLRLRLPAERFESVSQRLAGSTCERMASELDKLAAYGPGCDAETLDLLIPPDPQEHIYRLVDAALAGQAGQALAFAETLVRQGEPVPRLLFSLGNQLRTMLAVAEACRGGARPEAAASALGLAPFLARKAWDQSRRMREEAVMEAMEGVWEAELAMKTGVWADAAALDQAIFAILGAAGRLPAAPRGAGPHRRGGELPEA